MVQTHALTLLRPELRDTAPWWILIRFDGLVAPSFFFCSGLALALVHIRVSAESAGERWGRGLKQVGKVLAAATLVNAMWFNFLLEPHRLFRIDILHCIGLALMLALPMIVGFARSPARMKVCGVLVGLALFALAPFGEAVDGPFAGLFNKRHDTVFPLLAWGGYVFFGASVGSIVASGDRRALRLHLLLLALLGGGIWLLEPITVALYPPHPWGVSNPANHAQRWLFVTLGLLALMALEARGVRAAAGKRLFQGLAFAGACSLSSYVFHEALLFWSALPITFHGTWGRSLTWWEFLPVLSLLIASTLALCAGWGRLQRPLRALISQWRGAGAAPVAARREGSSLGA